MAVGALPHRDEEVRAQRGKTGDFHLTRGNLLLDVGEAFDLFSATEKEQMHTALFAKNLNAIRKLLN